MIADANLADAERVARGHRRLARGVRSGQGRRGRPVLGRGEEVAALVCFLASDEASFVTGGYYLVDGGFGAQ